MTYNDKLNVYYYRMLEITQCKLKHYNKETTMFIIMSILSPIIVRTTLFHRSFSLTQYNDVNIL